MQERVNAKNSELYSVIYSFIGAKQPIERADLEAEDLTFREDVKPVEQRAILRQIATDVNDAVEVAKEGQNAQAREMTLQIAQEYGEYFHDGPVQAERQKRAQESNETERELADRIIRKP